VMATQSFYDSYENNQPILILLGGIVIDGLLIYLFFTLARTREKALGEARDTTNKLSKREKELGMIFNNVPANIWYKDDENVILRLNKTAATAMGGTIEDFEGKNTYDLFPDIAKKYHEDDLEVIHSGKPKLGIIEEFKPVRAAHGWVRTDKVPYTDPVTGKKMILVVSQDITSMMEADIEREQLIAKLAASNEELERFAYIASHDLQEPLRMVKSYTQILQQKYESLLDEDGKKYINIASDAATRMQALIEDLLDYAKMGDNSDKYVDVNCNETVAYIVENLDGIIKEKKASLQIEDLPTVYANEVRIARLFQNLIGNAIKYSKAGEKPSVRVRVEDKDHFYEFSVKDNGIGMRTEYLDQIFEPFKRLHGKNEYPGTGIGLAICYKIIDGLGGRIWANSEINKGSTFYFTIPKKPKERDE
jgi:PAS domain S-box-containing protein